MTGAEPVLRPAAFLDRDGILNVPLVREGRPRSPSSVEQFDLYPEAPAACLRLRELGFAVVVVSNQPELARGGLDRPTLCAMHDELRRRVPVDGVYVCPHDDPDRCGCRKPAPGLLITAAVDLGLDLGASVVVGDRWRDIEAGRRAGCRTVHVDRHYDERKPESADFVAASLADAVRWIGRVIVGEGVTSD